MRQHELGKVGSDMNERVEPPMRQGHSRVAVEGDHAMRAGVGVDRLRVLVVDDDSALRRTLLNALRPIFTVIEAGHIDEARDFLARGRVDVLVSDFDLGTPETGLTLLREAREKYPATRRILMTGGLPKDTVVEDELVELVIKKPFDIARLIKRIGRR